ncbi:MAG: bifunctional pyr operon transcriptional regulator/uracil phosphoribosyltransferase PyrR [Halofilum sp. (in: g-proteobacteria)]|nr:bifunctional pyr operon transcriptional regulator/uracil phosphoribosyltransferase PyrR [Halofilum sp. (in: g-proteobacteria)]
MSIDADTVAEWLDRMAGEIRAEAGDHLSRLRVIGIHTGGVRVAQELHRRLGVEAPLGTLDISFYRDDFSRIGLHPRVMRSELPFDIDDERVLLVDDVVYSGRTVRAALNVLFDYGRPRRVMLATLVERTGHELPIRADFAGTRLDLGPQQRVRLNPDDLGLGIEDMPQREAAP